MNDNQVSILATYSILGSLFTSSRVLSYHRRVTSVLVSPPIQTILLRIITEEYSRRHHSAAYLI